MKDTFGVECGKGKMNSQPSLWDALSFLMEIPAMNRRATITSPCGTNKCVVMSAGIPERHCAYGTRELSNAFEPCSSTQQCSIGGCRPQHPVQ